jgi:hypothetical protein
MPWPAISLERQYEEMASRRKVALVLEFSMRHWRVLTAKAVLGDRSRAFRRVFDGAQKTLRAVFGMEMVELPVRDKLTKEEKRKGM